MNANGGSPEEVFKDFRARRTGILKALTIDVDKFFQECDPEKDNLCLYGFSDENWQVDFPAEEVPPELPEPVLGINFARDGMKQKDWLALVAVHSDSWLLAVSFYFGARFGFDKESRDRLFSMINSLPTIYEVVTGAATDNKKQHKEKTSNGSSKANNKSAPKAGNTTRGSQVPPPTHKEEEDEEDIDRGEGGEEEDEEEEGEEEGQGGTTLCGVGPVVTAMALTSSGSVVMCARTGSMGSVFVSPLHVQSTSSTTNALRVLIISVVELDLGQRQILLIGLMFYFIFFFFLSSISKWTWNDEFMASQIQCC